MFRRVGAFGTALMLVNASPAAAVCLDDVAQLEQRVRQLQAADDTIQLETPRGDVAMDRETGGAEPDESWFGAPPSLPGVAQQLQDARTMAEEGDENGCMSLVEQARTTLEALEP